MTRRTIWLDLECKSLPAAGRGLVVMSAQVQADGVADASL